MGTVRVIRLRVHLFGGSASQHSQWMRCSLIVVLATCLWATHGDHFIQHRAEQSQQPIFEPLEFEEFEDFGGNTLQDDYAEGDEFGLFHGKLPNGFDWLAYLSLNPDLPAVGIKTAEAAMLHYLKHGKEEGRPYMRLKITIRYTSCGGFSSQWYSHASVLTLVRTLKSSVAVSQIRLSLAPALSRDSYGEPWRPDTDDAGLKELSTAVWTTQPFDSLFDYEHLQKWAGSHQLHLQLVPLNMTLPDLNAPAYAFPVDADQDVIAAHVAGKVPNVFRNALPLKQFLGMFRNSVDQNKRDQQEILGHAPGSATVIDLPCTQFALNTSTATKYFTEVAEQLKVSPKLETIAHHVEKEVGHKYNAVHLRVEDDIEDWLMLLGGRSNVMQAYLEEMKRAGFNQHTVVYIASGLLSYEADKVFNKFATDVVNAKLAKEVRWKEQYLSNEHKAELHSEQLAAIDYLLLLKSELFVGLEASTMSFLVREMRSFNHNKQRATHSFLVNSSAVVEPKLWLQTLHAAGTLPHEAQHVHRRLRKLLEPLWSWWT